MGFRYVSPSAWLEGHCNVLCDYEEFTMLCHKWRQSDNGILVSEEGSIAGTLTCIWNPQECYTLAKWECRNSVLCVLLWSRSEDLGTGTEANLRNTKQVREMAPFTVSHANCLSVLAALLCAAPSSDIGAKPSGVQRGGSVAMWQACFRGKHHPQRAAVWQKACQLDTRRQDAWIWGWHWGLRCCRGHVGWGTWLGSADPQNGRVWLCSQCMVHGGRVTAAFWWPFLQPFLQVWGVLSAQDLQTWDLCLGYKFGSYPSSYCCTHQGSDSAHSQKKAPRWNQIFVCETLEETEPRSPPPPAFIYHCF